MKTEYYKASARVFTRMVAKFLPAALAATLVMALIAVVDPSSPLTGGFSFYWWSLPALAVLFLAFSVTLIEALVAHRENRLPGEDATEVRVD